MKIFYKRPLSLILCIMLGAFSLFSNLPSPYTYFLWALSIILFGLSFIKGNISISRALVRVGCIAFLISSLLSFHYFNFYYIAYERFSGETKIEGEITNVDSNDYYTYLTVNTDTINDEEHLSYKFLVMLDYEEKEAAPEFKRGYEITLYGKVTDFSDDKSNFNSNSYYLSKGYSAKIIEPREISVSGEEKQTLSSYFCDVRAKIAEFIIDNSNEESGGLLIALLLGEKEYLSPSIELDFRRIGISHILALSGLHLAILALGFSKLLSLFGLGKKLRSLTTIFFTLLYMILTGFPISVVRAGIMLIIASLLYLLANASDSFTSLSISVFIIVLINPYSIFDISLLLSAFATLGIVTLGDLPKVYPKKHGLKHAVLNSFIVSLFAISATFLISVLSFGEISVISPISTLVFSLLVEIFLYFGIVFLIFGSFLPLGDILIFLGEIIKDLASVFSSLDYIIVSTDFLLFKLSAIIFSIAFLLFLVLNLKRKKTYATVVASFMAVILLSGGLISYSAENQSEVIYNLSEDGDALLISGAGENSILEAKTYTTGRIYETLDYLKEEKLCRLDNYILTGYNSKMQTALYKLLSEIKIDALYLPKPKTTEEVKIYKTLLSLKDTFSVEIYQYSDEKIKLRAFDFTALYREGKLWSFEINKENKKYLIASSGILESEGRNVTLATIYYSDYVIFSRDGKKYKGYNFTYEFEKPCVIIVSSENLYIPAVTKAWYEKSGAELSLTPENYKFLYVE